MLIALSILASDPRLVEDILYIPDSFLSTDSEYVPPPAPLSISSTIFLVGDLMLGRNVETKIETLGKEYPFEGVSADISSPDLTVGNFEGVVTETHFHTQPFAYAFSIKSEYLSVLKTVGFDVLSLANNHSLDYGTSSLAYTRALCTTQALMCGGSPKNESSYLTYVKKIGTHTVGMVFLHMLYDKPDMNVLSAQLAELRAKSDVQIAYVHWGEEYVLTHNSEQERFAQTLIDQGVDVVVGHHPHVVQDLALYKNGLIVYSLGNFIFDQYFSDDVQEMIGLHMKIDDEAIIYTIVPYTSLLTKSQPHHMDEKSATILLSRIFASIAGSDGVTASRGEIIMPR